MHDAPPRSSSRRDKGSFITTRWSLVCAAGGPETEDAQRALEELCRTYWYPLYYYIRRRGQPHAEAEDLVQGFFVQLLDRQLFSVADPSRGKLRGLLLSSLQYYLADERKRAVAAKRGGGAAILPLDTTGAEVRYASEPADHASPDVLFERRWAAEVLDRAADALAEVWRATGKMPIFEALRPFLVARLDAAAARRLAADLGMTETHVKVSLHRLREQYGSALRRQVAETVSDSADIDEEMAALRAAICE